MLMIAAMALHALWVVLGFVAVMGWHRRHEIGDMPVTPIFNLRHGTEACVQGRAVLHDGERKSPIGGQPAVWFDWIVSQDSFNQKGGPSLVAVGSATEPFALVDDQGYRVLVWPQKADILEPREAAWDNAYPATIDGALRERLTRGVDLLEPLPDESRLHFTERWLPADAPCFVLGQVEAPGPEHGPDIRAVIRESGERHFIVSAGLPVQALAKLRYRTVACAIGAGVAFVLAMIASYALSILGV